MDTWFCPICGEYCGEYSIEPKDKCWCCGAVKPEGWNHGIFFEDTDPIYWPIQKLGTTQEDTA